MCYNLSVTFVRRLNWDASNVSHIARHQVTPEEVEQVCHGQFVSSETYKGRIRIIGSTAEGRMLTVILAPISPGWFYPVTARPASRKERQRYDDLRGGDKP